MKIGRIKLWALDSEKASIWVEDFELISVNLELVIVGGIVGIVSAKR